MAENKDSFVSTKLNELIDSQREIFDKNSIQLFFLGEAFTYTFLKKKIDAEGIISKESFDELLSTMINTETIGKFLEPMIAEYFNECAKRDIDKLHKWIQNSMNLKEIISKLQALQDNYSEDEGLNIVAMNIKDTYIHVLYKFKDNDDIYEYTY